MPTISDQYISINCYGPVPAFEALRQKLAARGNQSVRVVVGDRYVSRSPESLLGHTPAVIISRDVDTVEDGRVKAWEMLGSRLFLVIPADTSGELRTEPDNIGNIDEAAQFVTSNLPDGLALKWLPI